VRLVDGALILGEGVSALDPEARASEPVAMSSRSYVGDRPLNMCSSRSMAFSS
jgi:hypothetical protein